MLLRQLKVLFLVKGAEVEGVDIAPDKPFLLLTFIFPSFSLSTTNESVTDTPMLLVVKDASAETASAEEVSSIDSVISKAEVIEVEALNGHGHHATAVVDPATTLDLLNNSFKYWQTSLCLSPFDSISSTSEQELTIYFTQAPTCSI